MNKFYGFAASIALLTSGMLLAGDYAALIKQIGPETEKALQAIQPFGQDFTAQLHAAQTVIAQARQTIESLTGNERIVSKKTRNNLLNANSMMAKEIQTILTLLKTRDLETTSPIAGKKAQEFWKISLNGALDQTDWFIKQLSSTGTSTTPRDLKNGMRQTLYAFKDFIKKILDNTRLKKTF